MTFSEYQLTISDPLIVLPQLLRTLARRVPNTDKSITVVNHVFLPRA